MILIKLLEEYILEFSSTKDVKLALKLLLEAKDMRGQVKEAYDFILREHLLENPSDWQQYFGKLVIHEEEEWKLVGIRDVHEQLQIEQRKKKEEGGIDIKKIWVKMDTCLPLEIIDPDQIKIEF